MFTNWKLIVAGVVAVLLVSAALWVKGLYDDYQVLKFEHAVLTQNEMALSDSVKQLAGRVSEGAVFVRNLNTALDRERGRYRALDGAFRAYVDSIHDSGSTTPTWADSTVTVPFSGDKGIARYKGYTLYRLGNQTAQWFLDISFPLPIDISTSLFQEQDGIWRYGATSLTEGVNIKTTSTLDEDTFRRLQKYAPPEPENRFMFGAVLGQHGGPAVGYKFKNWGIVGYYSLLNKYPDVYKNVNVGLFWSPI
jgi:hypothetical protein